jgi:hypothetical protein
MDFSSENRSSSCPGFISEPTVLCAWFQEFRRQCAKPLSGWVRTPALRKRCTWMRETFRTWHTCIWRFHAASSWQTDSCRFANCTQFTKIMDSVSRHSVESRNILCSKWFCLPPSTHIAVFCLFLFGVMRDSTCRFGSLEIYSGICGQSRQEPLGTYIRPSMSHKKATKIDQV